MSEQQQDSTVPDADAGVAKVRKLVEAARISMLTSVTADGKLVSRPMGLQDTEFDGDLWFFASEDSELVPEVRANPSVNVSFDNAKSSEWTSISGTAEVVQDKERAKQLYSKPLDAWFPQGVDTPGLVLVKVHADSAEYWDSPGGRLVTLLGIARAAITRDPEKGPKTYNEEIEL